MNFSIPDSIASAFQFFSNPIAAGIGLGVVLLVLTGVLIAFYRYRFETREELPLEDSSPAISEDLLPHLLDSASQSAAARLYQPIDLWTGRLILPPPDRRDPEGAVWFEVHNADRAYAHLKHRVVTLKWTRSPEVQKFVRAVTVDVRFTRQAKQSHKKGFVHPVRLDKLNTVGPLESLAGARPEDNVIVALHNPVVDERSGEPSLIISRQPVEISGRLVALVTIIQRVANSTKGGISQLKIGKKNKTDRGIADGDPIKSDRFLVRHYNKITGEFDGPFDLIRIPQVPQNSTGIYPSTHRAIEKSPLNPEGWYVYGQKDGDSLFVVQAIEPRGAMRLKPQQLALGTQNALTYLKKQNWQNTSDKKGTASTILLDPIAENPRAAISAWQEGDKAIVIHVFGGIGGKKAEPTPFGVVTGHFSYGIATVVRDILTGELRFDIEYRQVYAHNRQGILSDAIKWFSFMGDLQRGWLGTRPICDILVKFDPLTVDYDFDGMKISPMAEFRRQLAIVCARYRTGNGTGASVVTPESSCVQDSNQALYITIKRIEHAIANTPRIQEWQQHFPDHPQTWQFKQLINLGKHLERHLIPFGIAQPDWRQNVEQIAASDQPENLISTLVKGIIAWRTMLPRPAQDNIAKILLKQGAALWVIRTNQVGGFNPHIAPTAPTGIFTHRLG